MSRTLNIEIKESCKELQRQMHKQRQGRQQERVYTLYLLQSHQVKTASQVATLIGRDYSTVKRWLRRYRHGGFNELLEIKHGGGRGLSIPKQEVKEVLAEPKTV
jgi:transposase